MGHVTIRAFQHGGICHEILSSVIVYCIFSSDTIHRMILVEYMRYIIRYMRHWHILKTVL